MKAVVLVAGVSRRLYPLTEHRPKCLLEVDDRPIFDYQMQALRACGVRDVTLVLGYRREQILEHAHRQHPALRFRSVINHRFFETNTSYSLWLARRHWVGSDFIYLNGDVLFEPELLQRTVNARHPTSLAVEAKACGEEEVKVAIDATGRIQRISKQLDPNQCAGEFIGAAKFDAAITEPFSQALEQLVQEGEHQAYFEAALDRIAPHHAFHIADVSDCPCIEIDFPEDYQRACRQVVKRFAA